ncbi:uncharacterized protein BCR38DRAFT_526721 [Pseudomassariella vexata]|uniref:BZIP domain-containing protein n=1 Tax=Pseudomassariella vexata TaxID=1141098 RepID=A0A1Y2DLP9_9PEZI|nr:uncharacterized protein BCR38DRAFT_526721 [Pseudomassariella vexata]ORY60190.1 hypothetical protein BCR38DRAFT_526721 [Pseudomassariella vexata]
MENFNSSPGCGRGKDPKIRKSEVRKEQNRVASRAYREKRKQKLALLEQILQTESRKSPGSTSDFDETYGALPVLRSRESSSSAPTQLPSVPVPTSWPMDSQALAPAMTFGEDSFHEAWMNVFDRTNDTFDGGNDFVSTFDSKNIIDNSASYLPTFPSMPHIPSMITMALDPLLSEAHLNPYHPTQSADTARASSQRNSACDQSWFGSGDETSMAVALETFSRLNEAQQQQLLAVLSKRKSSAEYNASEQDWSRDHHAVQSSGRVTTRPMEFREEN